MTEKRIVYIAYLIVFFAVFNFLFGFNDWLGTWQIWNWYLLILVVVLSGLVGIKFKQNQRKLALHERVKEADLYRTQLTQLLLFEQLNDLSEDKICEFLRRFYKLNDQYKSVDLVSNRQKVGYDLELWSEDNQKVMVKWFNHPPLLKSLYTYNDDLNEEKHKGEWVTLRDVREVYGVMKDYNIQADAAILITSSEFDEEAVDFAQRNKLTLINGEQFYHAIEQLRDEKGQWNGIKGVSV